MLNLVMYIKKCIKIAELKGNTSETTRKTFPQIHSSNVELNIPEEYWRGMNFITFLGSFIEQFSGIFS